MWLPRGGHICWNEVKQLERTAINVHRLLGSKNSRDRSLWLGIRLANFLQASSTWPFVPKAVPVMLNRHSLMTLWCVFGDLPQVIALCEIFTNLLKTQFCFRKKDKMGNTFCTLLCVYKKSKCLSSWIDYKFRSAIFKVFFISPPTSKKNLCIHKTNPKA